MLPNGVGDGTADAVVVVGAFTVMSIRCAPTSPDESVTSTVKSCVPIELGVPETRPEDGSRVNPAGSWPAASDHVDDPTPPVTVSCWE